MLINANCDLRKALKGWPVRSSRVNNGIATATEALVITQTAVLIGGGDSYINNQNAQANSTCLYANRCPYDPDF